MSASKQKRLRSAAEGPDRKTIAEQEKAIKDKKFRRNVIIFVCVLVVVVAAALVINSSLFYTALPAVEINGTSYDAVELSFFYVTAYNQFASINGDYLSYMLDPNLPLNQQTCPLDPEGGTWADYFVSQAIPMMQEYDGLYKLAVAEGYVIDDEITAMVQSSLDSYENEAELRGYNSLNGFLSASYCKGMTSDRYADLLGKYLLCAAYSEDRYNGFEYSDEELDAHYSENADSYDTFTYNMHFFSISSDLYAELETDEEKLAAAIADAEKAAGAASAEEFSALIDEITGNAAGEDAEAEPADTEYTYSGSELPGAFSEWMLDPERAEGDTLAIEGANGTGAYAVRFISRDNNQYPTVDVRHILIEAAPNDEGVVTEESLQIAEAELADIIAQWKSDPTEENFIALVNEYSDDTAVDGLYEKIYKGMMVDEFDAFCFAEDNFPGKTSEIVYGESSLYKGYHFIYFVGENELYSRVIADQVMREEDYSAFVASVTEGDAELKWASKFVSGS